MKNALVTWTLPTTRESGLSLDPADIANVEVSMSGDLGANFTPVTTVLPSDPQEAAVSDLDIGDWIFRLIVVDTAGLQSVAVDVPAVVDGTPPGAVTNAGVVLT